MSAVVQTTFYKNQTKHKTTKTNDNKQRHIKQKTLSNNNKQQLILLKQKLTHGVNFSVSLLYPCKQTHKNQLPVTQTGIVKQKTQHTYTRITTTHTTNT